MEGRMARARSGAGDGGPLLGGREFAGGGVETENEDAIEPLVRHDHRAAAGVEHHVMRMRTGLLDPVRAGLPGQGDHLRRIGQAAVRADRQDGHAAGTIIGHDQEPAAGIDRLMHGVAARRFQRDLSGWSMPVARSTENAVA